MGGKADFHDEMDRLQDHLENHLPEWASRNFDRLRRPEAVWVRAPAGIVLTAGGVLSVLPGLGLWMLPIGLALLAVDVPVMQDPLARALRFANRQIDKRKKRPADEKTG
ncbi:MAG TPA: hypothetical protein VFB31_07575 [Pseudolabrys sp.]|nr:hypothetical protein [Pseudolabrys sp.]